MKKVIFKKEIIFSIAIISLLIILLSVHWFYSHFNQITILSISSDGKYVISASQNKGIILWDIQKQKKKHISINGNIYSAYFIKEINKE